jgi:hypothetical protein
MVGRKADALPPDAEKRGSRTHATVERAYAAASASIPTASAAEVSRVSAASTHSLKYADPAEPAAPHVRRAEALPVPRRKQGSTRRQASRTASIARSPTL